MMNFEIMNDVLQKIYLQKISSNITASSVLYFGCSKDCVH